MARIAMTSLGDAHVKSDNNEQDKAENTNGFIWRRTWAYFLKTTTIHGIRYIWKAHTFKFQRWVWLGLVLTGVTVMSYQIIDRIIHYYKSPTSVNVAVNFNDSLLFPAITLCNQNGFRATVAVADGQYHLIQGLFSGNTSHGGSHVYSEEELNITVDSLYSRAAHRKEDMIVSCDWGTTPCSADNFTEVMTDHGLCYTFNGRVSSQNPLRAVEAGIKHGLHLVLNVEQYDSMPGRQGTAGVKVLVHDQVEFPLVGELGLAVPTGSHSFIGNTLLMVENLPSPHGKCGSNSLKYYPGVPYTTTRCRMDCLTSELDKECGCRDAYLPNIDGDPRVCSLKEMDECAKPFKKSFHMKERNLCSCPIPCEFTSYKSSVSFATMSSFNEDKLRSSLNSGSLHQKYVNAREIASRYERSNFMDFKAIIQDLAFSFEELYELFETKFCTKLQTQRGALSKKQHDVRQVWQKKNFIERFQLHMVRKNFLEGRRAMQERTLGFIGKGFQAFVLEVNRKLYDLAFNTDMKESRRDAIYRLLIDNLNMEMEMINRGIGNLTDLIKAYRKGIPIFHYVFEDLPLTHNAHVVPKKLLNESLYRTANARNHGLKTVGDLRLLNVKLMDYKNISQLAYSQKPLDTDNIQSVHGDILKYYKKFFSNKANLYFESLEWPERELENRIVKFRRLWVNFTLLTDKISRNFESITRSLDDMRQNVLPGLKTIVALCQAYLVNKTVHKTRLAQEVLRPDTAEKINVMKVFFVEVRTRGQAIFDDWDRLIETTIEIWREILTDVDSQEYYTWAGVWDFLQNLTAVERQEWRHLQALREETDILHIIGSKDGDFYYSMDRLTAVMETFQNSIKLDKNFLRENFILLDVFYSQLSYEQITQQQVYPIFSLLCDIGGSLGLFLGGSVLSIFEIVDLFGNQLFHFAFGNRRKYLAQ